MTYEEFRLSPKEIRSFKSVKARNRIKQFIKEHGTEPQSIDSFYEVSDEELEKYRRHRYAVYYAKGSFPNITDYPYTKPSKSYDDFVRLVYNVTTKDNPTQLFYNESSVSGIGYIEIDGVEVEPTLNFPFDTVGIHHVDIMLKDPTSIEPLRFTNINTLKEIVIPASVNTLGKHGIFNNCKSIVKITSLAKKAPSYESYNGYSSTLQDFGGINSNGVLVVPKDSDYLKTWLLKYSGTSEVALGNYGWTIDYIDNNTEY